MTITNNNELVEIRPGTWSKTPQIVDAGDNRRRRDKIRAFTFDFLEQNAAGDLIKNKEITRELSFSVWGDITQGGNTSFAHGTYTDGETEEIPDPENPGETITVLIEKNLYEYILTGGDPWEDEGIVILTLGEPDYESIKKFFDGEEELNLDPALPPVMRKLCIEYLLNKLTVNGVPLKVLGFKID